MKLFTTSQTHAWDAHTMKHEPIASVDLMNRASTVFSTWFKQVYNDTQRPVAVFAGPGNNGGDGFAVARLLHHAFYDVRVLVVNFNGKPSHDFEAQRKLLPSDVQVVELKQPSDLPPFLDRTVFIDALFGSGLNRPLEGIWAELLEKLNALPNAVAAIDVPSGMLCDQHTDGPMWRATYTFSFETPKRAFFFPENADVLGDWSFGSIGLDPGFASETDTPFHYFTAPDARALYQPRARFGHKGTFGRALLIAGSYGKMGAAVLAARGALRGGAGLVTVHAPRMGYLVLQTAVPEAMYSSGSRAQFWAEVPPELARYDAVGIGPGIGQSPETANAMGKTLTQCSMPVVLDADALNLLAMNSAWWHFIRPGSILTPHVGEFERLFGKCKNGFERNELQRRMAAERKVVLVLKGANTCVALPDGRCFYNSTGNPGMATGGTGDVLTGVLTALLAQGYTPAEAALLGVYLHGLAGDLAAREMGQEALVAGDVAGFLGKAYLNLGM